VTTRVLPRDEYARLTATELATVWPHLPESAQVIVVEDEDGQIVGCWSALPVLHAEGVWIAPDARRKGGVALRLLRGMREVLKDYGVSTVVTGAQDATVADLIVRLGGRQLPGAFYTLPTFGG
jgi:hypothetical protein